MKTRIAKLYRLALMLLLALVPAVVCAQTSGEQSVNPNRMVVRLSHPSQPAQVRLQTLAGNITVQGYNGNEVIINSSGRRNRDASVPEEIRGMRRMTQPDSLGADEDNNVVTIHTGLRTENLDLQVPASSMLSLKTLTGNIQVQGVFGELDLESTNGGIMLDQVGGSIVAHALNGTLTANVVRINADKPFSFSTLNGRIDVTLPAGMRANLNIRSDQGDIYLDQGFDFKPLATSSTGASKSESNGMLKLRMDNTIHGTINGGGVEINIRSFNGSILVHKGK
jgi:DUF4097 and DUF4098 domain-containing protein YvlB